jgi:hypothetical protein
MKKVFATLMCVLFLTVLFAQDKVQPTKVDVKPPDIPKCISAWITKNLPDYKVVKSYKIVSSTGQNEEFIYYVQTQKDKKIQWVMGDANCKSVKKINPKEAETVPKSKPPTTKE